MESPTPRYFPPQGLEIHLRRIVYLRMSQIHFPEYQDSLRQMERSSAVNDIVNGLERSEGLIAGSNSLFNIGATKLVKMRALAENGRPATPGPRPSFTLRHLVAEMVYCIS